MAGEKFLQLLSGVATGKAAAQVSAGVADAGKIIALDSTGKIDATMMPVGIAAETDTATASEALSAGDFVNMYASAGLKVRKADGSVAGKYANGFVLAAVANGATATVYRISQLNNQRTGMTPGVTQYLSVTIPGATQETIPTVDGQVIQSLGVASAATALIFAPNTPVVI